MVRGLAVASIVCLLLLITGVLVVESNEAYWWYGPEERMNRLVGGLVLLGLLTLVGLPLFFRSRQKRRR